MLHSRRFPALLAAALLAAVPAASQELRVRVAEPGRGTLAIGVLVSLLREDGVVAAAGVTTELGRVRLRAPAGGYRLRIERPGFTDTTVAVAVPAGLDSVTVTHAAARPAIGVRGLPVPAPCRAGGVPAEVAPAWREAERALRVVAATEQSGVATLSLATFERRLSTSLRRESEEVNTILGAANRPADAGPAGRLATEGYLTRDGGIVWAAPDVTVFAAEEFARSHCFGTAGPTSGREGMIGVRFEPLAGARVDIAGTAWLDPAARELRMIDYQFVGVPNDWRADRFGGSLEFHRSEQGFWVTRFWHQRVPRLETADGRERLRGYLERGAEVVQVTAVIDTTDRVVVARAIADQAAAARQRVAVLTGTVVDTLGHPVGDAEVAVLGTEFQTTSARDGSFRLGGLPLGLQIVRVRKVGYRAQHFGIRLAGGQEWDGRITIARLPQTLGEIVVVGKWGKPAQYANTAKYDGFYRRRATKGGRFLTREDIDKSAAGRMSELLRSVPGIRVGFVAPGQGEDVSFLTCPAYNVAVWIDGQKLTGNVGEILPLIAPGDVEAMEVYQRQALVPPEFRDNACAAIVIWTR